MKELIRAIENMQADHEESRLTPAISVHQSESCVMIANNNSDNYLSNRVVYGHINDKQSVEALYDKAEVFFDGKIYGWYADRDKDTELINFLLDRGWLIEDEYHGRYLAVKNLDKRPCMNVVEVQADSQSVRELVHITTSIWYTIDESKVESAIKIYNDYLKSSDRRGGYVLYYIDDKAVGYGTYRLSSCGSYMYLAGTGVLEAYRNRGVYRNILNYRINLAIEQKADYLITQARVGHSSPILEKCGFDKAGDFVFLVPYQA